ncbi:helix-turn-helix domain-containing protein [Desulfarculus baarsii]|uniref:helix-turn-helix domain-containing protein n=1 Tax=Desulfarculus baarsii TaxID=453230 RepID=UPI0011D14001
MLTTDDIWAELRRRRVLAVDIARELDCAPSTVTRAINGQTRSPASRILEHVARVIEVAVEELTPGRSSNVNHTFKQSHRSMSECRPCTDDSSVGSGL